MLRFEAVTRRYGSAPALEDVTFALEPGSLTVLTGVNGSGKSTLLRLAATLEAPSSGRIDVDGATGHEARRKLAWLGQEPGLYDDLTVRENLAFLAAARGADRALLDDAVDLLGVAPKLDVRVRALSRGEKQRAALVGTLQGGELLLLDEPTTALDAEGARAIEALLLRLRGARTMLVATHDVELVKRADRVLRLHAGRLTA